MSRNRPCPTSGLRLTVIAVMPYSSASLATGVRPARAQLTGNETMYAVIQTGGKQYRVAQGDTLRVERLGVEPGATIELDRVLMVADGENVIVGRPYVEGGKVTATVKTHGRGRKIRIVKFRRRKHHLKRQGHRQWYTELQVTGISAE